MKEFVGKMKVLIIAFGQADNVICLSKALSNYVDVSLVFVTSGDRFSTSIFDWDISGLRHGLITDQNIVNKYIDEHVRRYLGKSVRVYLARTPTMRILRDWQRKNLKCVKEITDFVKKQNFDVIHFNGSSGFQIYLHWFLRDKPKVYTIHDYLPHSGESTLKSRYVNILLNKLYTKLDYEFIQHLQFLTERFSDYYGIDRERVHTVYCGPLDIYTFYGSARVKEEPDTILFFGRISPYKGVEYLIEAFADVKKELPRTRLMIAGNGSFWFDPKPPEGCEIYNRHIPNDELARLIQRAALIVAPYTDATFSAVIMTAYAFGKPVIASAVGGIPEIVHDGVTGRLVPARDSKILADTIVEVLSDPCARSRFKENIRNKFLKDVFSWNHIAEKTIAIYERAVNGKRVGRE